MDDNLHYELIKVSKKPFLRTISFILNTSRRINTNYFDIVHVNELGGILLDKIDILTFHHAPDNPRKIFHSLPVYLEGIKAKKIITVSEDSKMVLAKSIWFNKEKISVIPNGINPKFLQEIKEDNLEVLKKKYNLEGKKLVLYINSNFEHRKNLPLMIETMKYLRERVPNVHLLIIIKRQYQTICRNLLKTNNIEKNVTLLSDLSDEEIVDHYHMCDLLAMPSTREGFGFPLIEALATGIPFVSFAVGIAPELVKEGYGKIAENDEDFKEKCLSFLNDPITYENSKDFIEKKYSWERSAERVYSFYKKLGRSNEQP